MRRVLAAGLVAFPLVLCTCRCGPDDPKHIAMLELPAGTFPMGTRPDEPGRRDDELRHEVTLTSPFLLGKYEVTQSQWLAVMGTNPSEHVGDSLPVENVSWHEAVQFCNRLSETHGLTPAYTIDGDRVSWDRKADGFRLPTEAEWEYACRAGTTTAYFDGPCLDETAANSDCRTQTTDCEPGTTRGETIDVGSVTANPWGLYDMIGNVREWCWDVSDGYPPTPQFDPANDNDHSTRRVERGGSWHTFASMSRCASRSHSDTHYRYHSLGFRVARSGEAP